MKVTKTEMQPVTVVTGFVCDRCRKTIQSDDMAFHETISIEHECGYESVFGDWRKLKIDLCQECVKETLGPWVRIEHPE